MCTVNCKNIFLVTGSILGSIVFLLALCIVIIWFKQRMWDSERVEDESKSVDSQTDFMPGPPITTVSMYQIEAEREALND